MNTPQRPDFITHLHAFRGFAIINIAAVHCWVEAIHFVGHGQPLSGDRYLAAMNEALFHGATLYFAFISGLLYSAVLRGQSWPTFFERKVKNSIIPYFVFTFAITLMNWAPNPAPHAIGLGDEAAAFLVRVGTYILNGSAMYHLWYIPVLVVLYVCTPLIVLILNNAKTAWLIYPLMLAPLVAPREWPQFSWVTVVYFLGAYCTGIYLGRGYAQKMARLSSWKWPLLGLAAALTVFLIYAYTVNWHVIAGLPFRESLFYIQKMSIAVFTLLVLKSREDRLPRILDPLATYAFTIYFLHALMIYWFRVAINSTGYSSPGPGVTTLIGAGFLIASLGLSVLFAIAVRRILGKWSRPLIGT